MYSENIMCKAVNCSIAVQSNTVKGTILMCTVNSNYAVRRNKIITYCQKRSSSLMPGVPQKPLKVQKFTTSFELHP